MGSSMHAAWHFTMFKREDFGVAYGYCCDLVRSASAPAPWWVTELQAGPTVFTGSRPLNPTETEISRWLWDAVGNGARGVVFWLWHPRTEGNEAGEWALAGPGGESTPRTKAAQQVAAVLKNHRAFFAQAKPIAARTAILYNRDAMILYAVDGWRRPTDEIMLSLMGCYKALHRANVSTDFLDSSQLEAGVPAQYKTLYLPYAYALSLKACESIRAFAANGGTVWADGLVGWKDERGVTKQFPPGPLSDVFGFTLEDIDAQWDPFPLSGPSEVAGELYRCVIPGNAKAKTILNGADGRPAATECAFGKGKAIYYATALTYSYLKREDPQVGRWIADPALANHTGEIRLTQAPRGAVLRSLRHPGGQSAAVITHWGGPGKVTCALPAGAKSALELITNTKLEVSRNGANTEMSVELKAGDSAVLLIG
jgi:beta-galactosidase